MGSIAPSFGPPIHSPRTLGSAVMLRRTSWWERMAMRTVIVSAKFVLPLALTLSVTACTDNLAGPGRLGPHARPVVSAAPGSTLDQEIEALIAQAFSGGHRTAVTTRWRNVKRDLAAGLEADAKAKLVDLVAWIKEKTPEMETKTLR